MTTDASIIVTRAILDSRQESRTVRLTADSLGAHYQAVVEDLSVSCDDSDVNEESAELEFRGADWRVHVEVA